MKENKRETTFTCGGCLEEIPLEQLHEFDGRNLCGGDSALPAVL